MAFIAKNGEFLVYMNGKVSFSNVYTENSLLTVGFVNVSLQTQSSLSPGTKYYLSTPCNKYISESYTLSDTPGLYIQFFSPLGKAMRLSLNNLENPIPGILSTNINDISNFLIFSSPNYQLVGYSEPLPFTLGSCKTYGCPNGLKCNAYSECVEDKPQCNSSSICSGPCYGRCPSGSTCQRTGNSFFCIKNNDDWSWAPIVILMIFGLLLLILIIGFVLLQSSPNPCRTLISSDKNPLII